MDNIKQLEAFVSIADTGSFSNAAKQLCLTQPTISAHIASLENELGCKLLERKIGESKLTATGAVLYTYARKIISMRNQALAACAMEKTETQGMVTIAASSIPYQYVLPIVTSEFHLKFPNVQFQLLAGNSESVASQVLSGAAGIGFVGTAIEDENLVSTPFMDDTLVVITPVAEPFTSMDQNGFSLEDLTREPFIIRAPGSGTRLETEAFLATKGLSIDSLHIVAEMDNPDAVIKAVSQGLGISIVSRLSALDYERFGQIRLFYPEGSQITRSIFLVHHKTRALSALEQQFVKLIGRSPAL